MNRRQKNILRNFIFVIIITIIAILAMINFKDMINRSEAMRAMRNLGQIVLRYREEHGSVPPESYVHRIKGNLEGYVRLGDLKYRARWIDFDSSPDEILAYSEKKYHSSLLLNGFIVLRLNGKVEWINSKSFEALLAQQQSQMEIEMTRK